MTHVRQEIALGLVRLFGCTLGFRQLVLHVQAGRDFAPQRRIGLLELSGGVLQALFVFAALEFRGRAIREQPQNAKVGPVPLPLLHVLNGDMTDHAPRIVNDRNGEVAERAQLFEDRLRRGEEIPDAAGKGCDLPVQDALTGRAGQVETARRPESPADPDCQNVRFIFRNVDLRHENGGGIQSDCERVHEFPKELRPGLGCNPGIEDPHQFRHALRVPAG